MFFSELFNYFNYPLLTSPLAKITLPHISGLFALYVRHTNTMNLKLLSSDAQKVHKELTEILEEADILTPKDKLALQMIAINYDSYTKATEHILKNGSTVTITNYKGEEVEKASPFVKIQLDSQIQLFKLLSEFYLTPKSRNKLTESDKTEPSPMDRLIGVIEKRTNATP